MTPSELKAFEDGVRWGVHNMQLQQLKSKKSVAAAADHCTTAKFLSKVKALYVKRINEARRKAAASKRPLTARAPVRDDGYQVTPTYARTPNAES